MDIKIRNLCKNFGEKNVLNNLNVDIQKNCITFLRGKSGIGKTTLLNILMGIEEFDSGEVVGVDRKNISAIFQSDVLFENLSVFLNLKLVNDNLTEEIVKRELEKVDLDGVIYTRVRELSGGMKRRIAILRAMLSDFEFMIMDEPLKGLDEKTKIKIMNYIIENTSHKTVLFVTHTDDEVEYFKNNLEKINVIEIA